MALSDKLKQLMNVKKAIKDAIASKRINMNNVPFTQYAQKINEIKLGSGNATVDDVLSGKTFSNSSGDELTGTMPNNGAVNQSIKPGDTYTVSKGYHNGSGKVTATQVKLKKVGNLNHSRQYGKGNVTLNLNISGSYSQYKNLTINDFCFSFVSCSGIGYNDGGTALWSGIDFVSKSYNADTGVFSVVVNRTGDYSNCSFSADVYILDRYGL